MHLHTWQKVHMHSKVHISRQLRLHPACMAKLLVCAEPEMGSRLQVSGLTKLLEGQKEASGQAPSRKENRRETWCPGAQGGGDPHA